jgi:hypothetical protein
MSNAVTIFSLPHDACVFHSDMYMENWRCKPENFLVDQPGPRTMASRLVCSPASACIVSMMCRAPSSFSGQHRTLGRRRVLHAGEGASAIRMRWQRPEPRRPLSTRCIERHGPHCRGNVVLLLLEVAPSFTFPYLRPLHRGRPVSILAFS